MSQTAPTKILREARESADPSADSLPIALEIQSGIDHEGPGSGCGGDASEAGGIDAEIRSEGSAEIRVI